MSITVLLADDHPIVREGLRRLIEAEPDLAVAAESCRPLSGADKHVQPPEAVPSGT